jgi:glycosyltransferase involved in cell wall biosynthesis
VVAAVTSVSVIVPCRDSPLVGETVASIQRQSRADLVREILVVGTDPHHRLDSTPPTRFVPTGQPVTAPVARNIAIRQATAPLLAFIDADCLAAPTWLDRLLAAQSSGHEIVGGAVTFPPAPYAQLCYNLTMFHQSLTSSPAGTRRNLGTLNLLVARTVVERIGLFDERLTRGQDTEWTLRMRRGGYRLFFTPEAVVTHLPQVRSVSAVCRAWRISGAYNGWIRAQYRDVIAPPPFYNRPLLLRLLAPAIGAAVTARVFASNRHLWRYAHALPVVYATKVAWCLGASQGLPQAKASAPPADAAD